MMKKILIVIILISFPFSVKGALTFGSATSDNVNFGNAAGIQNLSAYTFWTWIYPTDVSTNGRFIFSKGGIAKRFRIVNFSGAGQMSGAVDRGTADATFDSGIGSLSANTWQFVVMTYDENASAGEVINVYVGTRTSMLTEVSYTAYSDGSGATSADSGDNFYVANRGTTLASSLIGRMASFGYINRALSIGELRSLQFSPRKVPGTLIYSHLGFNGVSTQPDWSGNGNSGSVSGAVVSGHVPLRSPFGK